MKVCLFQLLLIPLIASDTTEKREANYLGEDVGGHLPPHLEGGLPLHHVVHHQQPYQHAGPPNPPVNPYQEQNLLLPGYLPSTPPHLESQYGHHPSHNCTVEDEVLQAEICTPTYTPSCGPFPVQGTVLGEREQCVTITRTVCTVIKEKARVRVCLVEYKDKVQAVTATTVQVKFERACEKQMVTVCEPQPSYGPPQPAYGAGYPDHSYHSVQHCKEVGQETCYNIPILETQEIQVEITLPEPVEKCENREIEVPGLECEDVPESQCVQLPTVEPAKMDATACVPVVSDPKCDKVELVLPKQVCRELLYGYAEKPIQKYNVNFESHHQPPSYTTTTSYTSHHPKIKYLNKAEDRQDLGQEDKQFPNLPDIYTE